MRKISIAPLLFVLAAATAIPVAAQGSANLRQLCPLARDERPAAPGEMEVGEVVTVKPTLQGMRKGDSRKPMDKCSKVFEGMRVNSGGQAGARIAVNPRSPGRKGFVLLGPDTEVTFSEFVIAAAKGENPKMSFRMQLGQFRVALAPDSDELGEGEYLIEVPATADREKVRLRLAGTDVYVAADERSTTVAVFEGLVTVESAGRKVQLTAGTWTRVTDGGPQPPMIFAPGVGKLSPSAGGPAFTVPDEMPVFDPGLLVIDDSRLNLPK